MKPNKKEIKKTSKFRIISRIAVLIFIGLFIGLAIAKSSHSSEPKLILVDNYQNVQQDNIQQLKSAVNATFDAVEEIEQMQTTMFTLMSIVIILILGIILFGVFLQMFGGRHDV